MDKEPYSHATGNGKLLLFGEHSAVFGYPAVGIPLPLQTEILNSDNRGIKLMDEYEKHREAIYQLFDYAEKLFKIKINKETLHIQLISSILPESGLGSSAALCTALIKYFINQKILDEGNQNDLWLKAHQLEHFFHGTPSGIDTGLATADSLTAFYFENNPLPGKVELPFPHVYLLYGTVPRIKSTKDLVRDVRIKMQRNPIETRSILDRLGIITEASIELLKNKTSDQIFSLGLLASEAHEKLQELDLSIELLDSILETAGKEGSLGGKLSGAGGGGAFWFITDSLEKSENLKAIILKQYQCQLRSISPGVI